MVEAAADGGASGGEPIVRLTDVWRTYDVGSAPLHALREIDETIAAGEHVAIMGPSGSGKSTLLNVLGCLDRPSRGRYVLAGRDVGELSEAELAAVRRHRIGFIFQSFHLVPRLDARRNVELPMTFAGVERRERRRRAEAALAGVGMAQRSGHRPDQLSGGERQRVAIARALAMGPRVLLADEPTGNLDTRSGHQVLDLLGRLNDDGITLVVVTHDPNVARRADRVITLVDGRIVGRVAGADLGEVNSLIAAAEAAVEGADGDAAAGAESAGAGGR
jgi:putative ABC transport system ATP-binding protein